MKQELFDFEEKLVPLKQPVKPKIQDERVLIYHKFLQEKRDKFDKRKAEGKETYFLSGDSMKCLICGSTIWDWLYIKHRFCNTCDIFHDE